MLTVESLAIPEVRLLTPQRHHDERGFLAETAHQAEMEKLGLPGHYPQENQSLSLKRGTVRGLHAQRPPHAQAKLLRVLRGAIYDVAVDVRPGSPTYGRHVGMELSEDRLELFYIPPGFLHGFCTLTDHTVVLYKMSAPYAPGGEVACRWDDPDLGIAWPLNGAAPILSAKDAQLPPFASFPRIDW